MQRNCLANHMGSLICETGPLHVAQADLLPLLLEYEGYM